MSIPVFRPNFIYKEPVGGIQPMDCSLPVPTIDEPGKESANKLRDKRRKLNETLWSAE